METKSIQYIKTKYGLAMTSNGVCKRPGKFPITLLFFSGARIELESLRFFFLSKL